MLSLITTVIDAISVVLYPTIKSYSQEKLTSDYNKLIGIIAVVTGFCMVSYYPLLFIVEHWLKGYCDSLPVFRVILPGVILSSCVTMVMFNYYKAERQHVKFFKISLIVLILSIIADILAYSITRELVWVSAGSVFVMGLWYLFAERHIVNTREINTAKNKLYIAIIIIGYYLITAFIINILAGLIIYFLFYATITYAFYGSSVTSILKPQQ